MCIEPSWWRIVGGTFWNTLDFDNLETSLYPDMVRRHYAHYKQGTHLLPVSAEPRVVDLDRVAKVADLCQEYDIRDSFLYIRGPFPGALQRDFESSLENDLLLILHTFDFKSLSLPRLRLSSKLEDYTQAVHKIRDYLHEIVRSVESTREVVKVGPGWNVNMTMKGAELIQDTSFGEYPVEAGTFVNISMSLSALSGTFTIQGNACESEMKRRKHSKTF